MVTLDLFPNDYSNPKIYMNYFDMYRSKYLHVYFFVKLYLKKRDNFCEGMKSAHSSFLLLKTGCIVL